MTKLLKHVLSRIENAKRVSGDIIDLSVKHTCTKEFCNPENEADLIVKGFLMGPIMMPDVYVCKYRSYHICNSQTCKSTYGTGVCVISGACYGPKDGYASYDKSDPRTFYINARHSVKMEQQINPTMNDNIYTLSPLEKVKVKQKTRKSPNFKRIRLEVVEIITKLLFSDTRKSVNKRYRDNRTKIMEKKIQNYIKSCYIERVPVNMITIKIFVDKYNEGYERLEILNYSEDTISKYTNLIVNAYKIVLKYYDDAFKVPTISLGVLYEMRQGYEIEGLVLFEADPFLLHNLPTINDILQFGFDRANITKGKHIIQAAYKRGVESGASMDQLLI